MADIINFADHAKKKPTVEYLSQRAADEILANWEKFAANNRLNDFFLQSAPSWATQTNYLEDLTALSLLEQKIKLDPQICSPGFLPDNMLGWIASFRINGIIVTTPFMPTEQYARCFNVLLYLKIKRELVTNEIPVTT